jgi:hypothetical protein
MGVKFHTLAQSLIPGEQNCCETHRSLDDAEQTPIPCVGFTCEKINQNPLK